MASRFTQYGGAAGADAALREMVAQRIAAEMEQRKQAVEAYKLSQTDRGMDLEGGRLQEDARQFDAGAPGREANTGYLRTQTKNLESLPTRAADDRAHDAMMQQTEQADALAKIKATGDQQARVAGIRTTGGSGDDLATFEAKEQIKARYGGSKPSLGAERKILEFYNRAKQASDDIGGMEDGIAKMGLGGQARLEYAPNFLQSDDNQRYRQAQRAFTEARLRKESGAAIPQGEYDNDSRTYFAQPGDAPAVIQQKRAARERVMEGMKFSSGKAYDEFYGQQEQAPQGGPVPMVAPDGRPLMVPADRVAEMESKGAKRR